jgi:hypothetical protein
MSRKDTERMGSVCSGQVGSIYAEFPLNKRINENLKKIKYEQAAR